MLLVQDDHCNEAMSSEDDVNEATAALKGMLGIGGDSVTQTPKKKEKKETNAKGKGGKNNKSRPGSTSKRNKTPSKNETGKGKKKNNKQPQKENFAWSAFQASPDASALPIPAFASPADSSRKLNETAKQLDEKKLSKLFIAVDQRDPVAPDPIDISKAPRAEDLEAQVIAEAEKAAGNISKSDQPAADCKEKEATISDETLIEVSDSGVNLAALASPLSIKETRKGDLSHGGHGTSTLPIQNDALPSTPFSSPNQTSTAPYQSPGAMQQQQQQQQQIHNAYMQPSMGYVTIQVQVPPVLMPDRRMVVTSPAGYPVQIVVPEGVPPGMIIPVHVPTAPLIQSPYGNYGQQLQQQVPYNMHHQYHSQQDKFDPKKR